MFFNTPTTESAIFFATGKSKQTWLKTINKLFFIQIKRMNIDTFHILVYFLASIGNRQEEKNNLENSLSNSPLLNSENSVVCKHRATKGIWYSTFFKKIKSLDLFSLQLIAKEMSIVISRDYDKPIRPRNSPVVGLYFGLIILIFFTFKRSQKHLQWHLMLQLTVPK